MDGRLNAAANYFIRIAAQKGCGDLTPMKLLKLVFIANGWHLALTRNPLFLEEAEAWVYGPVVPDLYRSVKAYRSNHIDRSLDGPDYELDAQSEAVMDYVWERYGHMSGVELSSLTHRSGTPWSVTWDGGQLKNRVISTALIADYYSKLMDDAIRAQALSHE